jgi:hypothetical protein
MLHFEKHYDVVDNTPQSVIFYHPLFSLAKARHKSRAYFSLMTGAILITPAS